MDNVTVPGWIWGAILGAILYEALKKVVGAVMDVILVKKEGKSPPAVDPGAGTAAQQASACLTTCKAQWEKAITEKASTLKDEIGVRIDAGFQRIHERMDEIVRGNNHG